MNDLTPLLNPFQDRVVQDAWQSPADVESIHRDVFRACIAAVEAAARGEPDSLLIYGSPGSGKTHLLTRVQRHLAESGATAPDKVLRCIFVYVRLQTSPQHLWEHVRRRLANDLMRSDQGLTQLQRVVAHQMSEARGTPVRQEIQALRVSHHLESDLLSRDVQPVLERLDLPRDLRVVIEHLVLGRHVSDARAWLAGDNLPEPLLNQLGLGADTEEDREEVAKSIVLGLCRLAVRTLPIVLCFDQVEALLRQQRDLEAFFRFGRMGADLHDADPNVCLLTCIQSAQIEALFEAVLAGDRQRFAKLEAVLHPLSPDQVKSLVTSRLDASAPLASLRATHGANPLYPFDTAFIADLSQRTPCVPRGVLANCARQFEALQRGGPVQPIADREFLTCEFDRRVADPDTAVLPGRVKQVLVNGARALEGLGRLRRVPPSVGEVSAIDLVVEAADGRTAAISVRNEVDGRALWRPLKALAQRPADGKRIVIVRDPRAPFPRAAAKAQEHLATLRRQGAIVVEPTVEAMDALGVLSSIVADAQSGDLANQGETLTEGAVLTWLRGWAADNDARLAPLDQLVMALFDAPPSRPVGLAEEAQQALAEIVSRKRAVDIQTTAREVQASVEDILHFVRRLPERYLVLEGPPAVLLDMAGVVQGSEAAR